MLKRQYYELHTVFPVAGNLRLSGQASRAAHPVLDGGRASQVLPEQAHEDDQPAERDKVHTYQVHYFFLENTGEIHLY